LLFFKIDGKNMITESYRNEKKVLILLPEKSLQILYMKKCLLFVGTICLLLASAMHINAQDPGFSQFYGNPLYLNPALAGNKICPRLTFNYRNQWPSIPASFITYSAAYDQYVDFLSGGVGLLVVSDQAGDGLLITNSFSGLYSYRLEASRDIVLNAGMQATYQQMSIDDSKLIFADMLTNGTNTSPDLDLIRSSGLTQSFPDFSAGLLVGYRESIYLGFAAHHLTQPDNGFYSGSGSRLLMKYTIHAGAIFNLIPATGFDDNRALPSISPNILYQQQGEFRQMNAGLYLNIYPFVAGLWFRYNFENPDAAIALLGFEYNQFKIGYSYDYTVSRLTNATGGAHEVSVAWQFACLERSTKIKAIKCPTF
jgi:type IX secretion system PorP/SprF family membrane protein